MSASLPLRAPADVIMIVKVIAQKADRASNTNGRAQTLIQGKRTCFRQPAMAAGSCHGNLTVPCDRRTLGYVFNWSCSCESRHSKLNFEATQAVINGQNVQH